MKKAVILMGFLQTIMIIFIIVGISHILKAYRIQDSKFKSKLNTEYILQKDTLIIIDYNIWNGTYILSNGIKIDGDIIFKDTIHESTNIPKVQN